MKGIYSWIDWMPFSFIEKTLGRYILDTGSATYRFGLLFPFAVSTKANLCASQLFPRLTAHCSCLTCSNPYQPSWPPRLLS
jgi:hypothetical protein